MWQLQGGNARESTVAKMCAEVKAHALYEKSAALARATGSRRIPKLRPSPSSPTGWAIATQQSSSLHALISASSLAIGAEEVTSMPSQSQETLFAEHAKPAALQPETDFRRPGIKHIRHISPADTTQQQQQTPSMGREAQLLFGLYNQPGSASNSDQQHAIPVKNAKAKVAEVEAVIFEEKYHRAGREVLGQRMDLAAAALAAQERSKAQKKAVRKQLGYAPLQHRDGTFEDGPKSEAGRTSSAPQHFGYASAV